MKNEQTNQIGTSRRSVLAGLLGLPAVALTAASARAVVVHAQPAVVRQRELQAVIDLFNQAEILAASIRRRLEAGAPMERGKLGVSTCGYESLQDYCERGIGENEGVEAPSGLIIQPVERLTHIFDDLKACPDYPYRGITLA